MEELVQETLAGFTEKLASKSPVPGGGGAAALVGALGASLCAMAGNLTLGRKKYADVEEDIRALLVRLEDVRRRLLELVDEDARGFAPLAAAYGIPKDQPDRAARLQEATLQAIEAPMEMMRQIARAVALTAEMLEKGSAMLVSDVGCAALLCQSALESAALNVFVNTKTLPEEVARLVAEEAQTLLELALPQARSVADEVFSRLR